MLRRLQSRDHTREEGSWWRRSGGRDYKSMLAGNSPTSVLWIVSIRLAHVLVPSYVAEIWHSNGAHTDGHVRRCSRGTLIVGVLVFVGVVDVLIKLCCNT